MLGVIRSPMTAFSFLSSYALSAHAAAEASRLIKRSCGERHAYACNEGGEGDHIVMSFSRLV